MTVFEATPDDIAAQAAQWHVASSGDAMDWDAFTLWLEADPRHRACYDEVALADALLGDHAAALAAPEEPKTLAPRRRLWLAAGTAVAAALALAVVMPGWRGSSAQDTLAGDSAREIALADGSHVTLAPHSRLTVAGDRLTLYGEARFAIRHDPARTLQVVAGPLTIEDIGTVFDVAASGATVRVAVNAGKVAVVGATRGGAVQLGEGDGLMVGDGPAPRTVPAQALGLAGWTGGTLSYVDAPLPVVVDDIARLTGARLALAPALRTRRFSGALTVAPGTDAAQALATLLHLRLVRQADQASLQPLAR
jgi:transmembrane sensor